MANVSNFRTRGIRNNNPFNIKNSANTWLGKIPASQKKDKTFEEFVNIEFGLRAGIKLLRKYIVDYGLVTPYEIINRFAPSSENNTVNYVKYVESFVYPDGDSFPVPIEYGIGSPHFYRLCYAMLLYESNYKLTKPHFFELFRQFHL